MLPASFFNLFLKKVGICRTLARVLFFFFFFFCNKLHSRDKFTKYSFSVDRSSFRRRRFRPKMWDKKRGHCHLRNLLSGPCASTTMKTKLAQGRSQRVRCSDGSQHVCLVKCFYYIRCITPKCLMSWWDPPPLHCACGQQLLSKKCHSGGEPLSTLSPILDRPKIWTPNLPLERWARTCRFSISVGYIYLQLNQKLSNGIGFGSAAY